MKTYRELRVWQEAIALVPMVYAVVRRLPREERYELGSQMRRAAVSVPANIAEGQARQHRKEFLQALHVSKGSLAELETLLIVAERLCYLSQPDLERLQTEIAKVRQPLHGLIDRLRATDNTQRTTHNTTKS